MKQLKQSYLKGLVLVGLAGLLFFPLAKPTSFHVDETKDSLFENFPKEIGNWVGEDTPVDETTYEILETRNVLSRIYKKGEDSAVHLLLVSSHKDRRVAHPPEVCYLSSNYRIVDKGEEIAQTAKGPIALKSFIAENERTPSERQKVIYVYKIGEKLTTSYYAQQIQFALDQITRKQSNVLLVRIAGPEDNTPEEFFSDLLGYLASNPSESK